jgi:phosphopantetheine--protein transferase-like protein
MASHTIVNLDWKYKSLDNLPALPSGAVHLVYLPLCVNGQSVLSDSQRLTAVELLSDIQWDRFERRPVGAGKETYLAGRYYLLNLLAHYSDKPVDSIRLSYNRLNKPFLQPNLTGLEFNFTDTSFTEQDRVVSVGLFAFSLNAHVGVDIEAAHRQANTEKIAARRFTALELDFYNSQNHETTSKAERFLQIWTRKEAFGKACGVGINFKMNTLNLMGQPQQLNAPADHYSFEHRQQAWCLQQFYAPRSEIACITHTGADPLRISAFELENELDRFL